MAKQSRIIPLGRLEELKSEPKSGSMAYRSLGGQGTMNFDAEVRTFPSRDALKTFLKKEASHPSHRALGRVEWTAIVKDLVGKNMVAHPSYERESPDARMHERGSNPRVSRSAHPTDPSERFADLMKQGFWKPRKFKKAKVEKPIVACARCQDWHREGKHIPKKVLEERRLKARLDAILGISKE